MTTGEQLDLIDRLRAHAFVDTPVRLGRHVSGPGYHLVGLGGTRDFWEDDGSYRAEATDQIGAAYGSLTQALTDRWGEPQVFSPDSLNLRALAGEAIPQPWQELSHTTDHLHLWRAEDSWLVVCVARWGEDDPYLLMAAVTVVDPP
ncbi:hypothetical protein [Streptomyces sp. Isolate_45]|uniref:hypothetical protein n=1 Tax=Streptomyces sp. Isolate_45 TaxID=2950111 RepID=UPI002481CA6B|nr:hypothetical protein [Streptomyces sp. Isolate_45]MDA5280693.1 hypothetical protein [Streptomyces sp. Isolate_45]